jgi:hypothetical protein
MAPITATKDRQFAFILSGEEHQMLTALADAGEVSAAEWLREAIRTAHSKGDLESMAQKVQRMGRAVETEHAGFMERWRRVTAVEGSNVLPSRRTLKGWLADLNKLNDTRDGKGWRPMRTAIEKYEALLERASNETDYVEILKYQNDLETKVFRHLQFLIDEWLDEARAEER